MRVLLVVFLALNVVCGNVSLAQTGNTTVLRGRVIDTKGNTPLSLANVAIQETQQSNWTDYKGDFLLKIPSYLKKVTLQVSYVGRQKVVLTVTKAQWGETLTIQMKENSLTLEEVNVTSAYSSNKNSISSIVFDEEAIERVQAFSLMDVLNTLPGKQMTAPNINAPQLLTLRNTLGGNYDINNSLGIPIIMDGVTLSNDANMQSRLVSQWGMGGSALRATLGGNTADVPFRGIDLREIPVESIEKIEVIQGVASAEYGELTDGAILIERKAARSPLQFTTNINDGSRNFSLNKGFDLSKRWGGVTVDANYAISNSNPQDKVQEYKRYGVSLRWNTPQYKRFRNKLSVDFNKRVDDAKMDPDDVSKRKYYSKESGIRLSNSMSVNVGLPGLDNMSLILSYSERKQESFAQWLINRGFIGIGGKDTTGIYEGTVVNGRYMAEEEIIGNPVTASANFKLNTSFSLGGTYHNLSYGFSGNYTNNGGKGIIADPERPRFLNLSDQNVRPYDFELTPSMLNTGVYFTDNFNFQWLGKQISSNFGFRLDSQNESISFQPRLSTLVTLNDRWNIGAAYGVSTKSPTLLHRYPPPAWIDIPLIFAANTNSSLYLLYTEKLQTANKNLRPSKSSQAEVTLKYRHEKFNSSLNAYYKDNKNGFNSLTVYFPIRVPEYSYHYDAQLDKIVYEQTGQYNTYRDKSYNAIDNTRSSYTYGVDWALSTNKISAINTTLSTSTSFIISKENNGSVLEVVDLKSPVEHNGENIWYALYNPLSNNKRYVWTSKLNSTTHIPKLGFVIMTNTDIFWMNRQSSVHNQEFQEALGYLNENMERVLIPSGSSSFLPVRSLTELDNKQRIVYANFSLSVAKEIGKKIRIAVTTYNTFNLRPTSSYYNPKTNVETITIYNSPLSVTGGITFKI